jgi:hypothetical protein
MKTTIFTVIMTIVILSGCNNEDIVNSQEPMNFSNLKEDGTNSQKKNVNSQKKKKLPNIEKATFSNSTIITNNYYGPAAGETYVYRGGKVGVDTEEEIRIERGTSTKVIMGVTCVIQHDLVYLDNIKIEDTDDWLAQDDDGNLWYFGEFVKNYDDSGNFIDNAGSWEFGVDGALPGYWMPENPSLGQSYYQEYYKGNAEDRAEVIAVGETVTIGLGTYTNCIITKDFTRFEPYVYEKKYYAPGVGLIKEEKFEKKVLIEIIELTEIID